MSFARTILLHTVTVYSAVIATCAQSGAKEGHVEKLFIPQAQYKNIPSTAISHVLIAPPALRLLALGEKLVKTAAGSP